MPRGHNYICWFILYKSSLKCWNFPAGSVTKYRTTWVGINKLFVINPYRVSICACQHSYRDFWCIVCITNTSFLTNYLEWFRNYLESTISRELPRFMIDTLCDMVHTPSAKLRNGTKLPTASSFLLKAENKSLFLYSSRECTWKLSPLAV